ncbi:MAG: hypothetical protein ABI895_08600 [Deltaproteobacteria bacterium]
MSQNRKLTSLVSAVTLCGLTGLLVAACGDSGGDGDGGGSCTELGGRVTALQTSAAALTTLSGTIKADVIGACAQIADMTAPANPMDSDVTSTCNAAKAKISAALNAGASITIVPPVCSVDAQAQFSCEGSCNAKAEVMCEPGEVEVRCDPGDLSVECSGQCKVDAQCEGSATVAVACEAKCEGKCTGTCSGKCSGACDGTCSAGTGTDGRCEGTCTGTCTGECDANCMGQCNGSCTVKASGGVRCSGGARCKGGCDVEGTAPRCEGTLKPPSCEGSASAQCNADCEGAASLKATCTDPSVTIVGMADVNLRADLVAALPKLVKVAGQSKIALEAVADLGESFGNVVLDVPRCTVDLGVGFVGMFTGAAQATATATASVSVSFKASADVSASAGG